MATVWLSRFSRWLEALNNAKGGPVVFDINADAGMMWVPFSGVEERYLQGWNRFGAQSSNGAVAAQNGLYKLRNPPGSNVIIVVESIIFGTALVDAPELSWGASTTDLTNIVSLTFTRIDPRGQPQPTAIFSSQTSGAVPAILQQINIGANSSAQFVTSVNTEYTILPGQAIQLSAATPNQANNSSWLWRERALQTSELT